MWIYWVSNIWIHPVCSTTRYSVHEYKYDLIFQILIIMFIVIVFLTRSDQARSPCEIDFVRSFPPSLSISLRLNTRAAQIWTWSCVLHHKKMLFVSSIFTFDLEIQCWNFSDLDSIVYAGSLPIYYVLWCLQNFVLSCFEELRKVLSGKHQHF